MRHLVRKAVQAYLLEYLHGALFTRFLALAGHFQAERGVVQHAARGHQGEGLEDHAHVAAAQVDQLRLGHLGDVLPIDVDVAGTGFNQAVDQADQGRFAGTGEAHQHENFTFLDAEGHVADADNCAFFRKNSFLAPSLFEEVDGFLWLCAEHLVEVFDDDFSRLHGMIPLQ